MVSADLTTLCGVVEGVAQSVPPRGESTGDVPAARPEIPVPARRLTAQGAVFRESGWSWLVDVDGQLQAWLYAGFAGCHRLVISKFGAKVLESTGL